MQNVRDYIEVGKVANRQETGVETLPDEADFFAQYSTVEGHLPFRHPENVCLLVYSNFSVKCLFNTDMKTRSTI